MCCGCDCGMCRMRRNLGDPGNSADILKRDTVETAVVVASHIGRKRRTRERRLEDPPIGT